MIMKYESTPSLHNFQKKGLRSYFKTIASWKVPHYANLTNRGSQKLKRPLQINQRPKKELIKTQQIHKLQRANLLILNFGRHLWDFGVIFAVYKFESDYFLIMQRVERRIRFLEILRQLTSSSPFFMVGALKI